MVDLSDVMRATVKAFADRGVAHVVAESALAKRLRESHEREELRRWLAGEARDISTSYEQTGWGI